MKKVFMKRSQRSTKGNLPQRFKDFYMNMSGSSTPTKDVNAEHNSSSNANDEENDETVVEQQTNDQNMISCLMERLKTLEENHQHAMQQLLESEVKRAHLQEELSGRNAATKLPPPVAGVPQVCQPSTVEVHNRQNNGTVCVSSQTSIPSSAINRIYTPSGQQPIVSATIMPTAECQSTLPPYQSGNGEFSMPPTTTSTNLLPPSTGYATMPHTTSMSTPYAVYTPVSQTGMYTSAGLPYATNVFPSQPQFMPAYANVYTPMSNNNYGATRKLYDLPEFHGQPEQWPVFITAFRESSNAYGYTALENTFRLQKCLKGVAREEVECLLINPQNVLQIIEQLEFKYGRPELLIKSQLQKIREIAPIHENQLEKIVPFATKVQNLTTFLKSANATQHLSNPTMMEELTSKMPMTKRIEWVSYSSQINPYPTLEHFNAWINQISKLIAKVSPTMSSTPAFGVKYQQPSTTTKSHASQNRVSTKPVLTMNEIIKDDTKKQIYCAKCNDSHYLSKCDQFLKMSVDERWSFVKSNRLCFSCLSKGHSLTQCKRKKSCHVDGCKKLHNTTLHQELKSAPEQVNMIRVKPFTPKTTKLLYKIVPVELRGPNNNVLKTYAFLDEGSSSTLIHDALARQMGFNEKEEPLTLSWFEGASKKVSSMSVKFQIKGPGKNKKWFNVKAHSVPQLDLPSQTVNLEELHDKFQQLKSLPIAGYIDAVPQVLIGLDNCHLTPNTKTVQLDECVIAANTPLGWAIYGQPEGPSVTNSCRLSVILHTREEEEEQNIDNLVADYFTTENFGVALPSQPLESKDVVRARQILKDITTKVDDRYETGLLWKNDNVYLPNSYNMALNRLHSIEKKMENDGKFANDYKTAMTDYISSGYAKKMSPSEVKKTTTHTWYLPHFAVFNINKPGKLRLVFDAAAAVNGTSLNSVLLKGPDENQTLLKILFQFREGAVGVCADIKEMFLQVRIREADQDAQRFLWRFSPNYPVETYTMAAMIFGATCSPCSAQYVKNLNALENASDQPEVIDKVLNNHYVDDMVCSFKSEEEALQISSAVKTTHAKAGFNLRGFVSNSSYVQNHLNGEVESQSPNVNMNAADAVEKVLGMFWRSNTDDFIFKLQLNRVDPEIVAGNRCPTKRELLCLVMSVYDPFGMLANLLVYGKILLQELWRTGVGWDEDVPDQIYQRFAQWVKSLQLAKQFSLPRCYYPQLFNPGTTIELHIFNDASETAFASVAYWRIVTPHEIKVCFIAGKTKCAPLKVLSVPRLELQAAVLGTRLKNAIVESHTIKPSKIILWSDSKTVISWIKSDHRQYKAFVMHRVGEILETTHENDWRWVSTNLNAADAATRTTYPVNYTPDNIWIKGPKFLSTKDDDWPKSTELCPVANTEEEKKKFCMAIITTTFIDFNRFSSYLRLQRTTAWVIRFCDMSRKKSDSHGIYELSASELQKAEVLICKLVQQEVYSDEVNDLKVNDNVSKNSSIASLTPRLNADGVLCVYGRIDYALALPESTRHPIILPYRHAVTELIVMWYHHKLFHQNDDLVVNEIRRKFWIPHLRAAVKRAKSECQQCKNNRAKPKPPLMGQLPIDRLQPYVRPFTYTGLDYFGPIYVTIGRRREKRWAALFTCLTIRAIHIELAADLSTDACIICIRNFVNRRGVPVKIRSDMGTNFVGADGELKRVSDLFDHNYIQSELATKNITWEFNCPANPSSGGCWERLVQSTKKVLAVTLKGVAPQVETLRSLLIEAENVVNSRPLTHLPVTPENPDPLTPNHFLLGTTNSTQTPGDVEAICSRKQYRISQQLKNQFWRRWIREYLPTLTKRTKWFTPQKPIEVDDMVIICDENLPRSQWRRGIVTSKFTAKDKQTRIVEVRTANGTLRRPVSKLAVLDIYSEAPQDLHEGRNVADT